MDGSPPSQSLFAPTSAPAPPPPCLATSCNNLPAVASPALEKENELSKSDEPAPQAFNDPFTGIPSTPSDAVRLYMLCRGEPRYCCYSIPGSLFFLYMFAPPWKQASRPLKKKMPPSMRSFRLRCESGCKPDVEQYCKHQLHIHQRLYTEWLFSGGAPTSLAKLHRGADGSTSVSFSAKVRAALYILRRGRARNHSLGRTMPTILEIFGANQFADDPDEEAWCNVIIGTEPIEMPAMVWSHAYPRPTSPTPSSPPSGPRPLLPQSSSTTVQTRPFRGVASLQSTEPDDVPPGWYLWTPVVVSRLVPIARQTALEYKRFQKLTHVDGGVAAPSHEMYLYWNARGTRPPSPDATLGADEEDVEMAEAGADDHRSAQSLRTQLTHRLTQARPTNTPVPSDNDTPKRSRGRPRKSATPAPTSPVTKPVTKPIRLRLVAPRRPSTPEQAAFFEEAMIDQPPPHAHNDESGKANIQYLNVTQHAHSYLRNDAHWQLYETEAENARTARREVDKSVAGVGMIASAYESCLFNPEDFE